MRGRRTDSHEAEKIRTDENEAKALAAKERFRRTRLLNEELDKLVTDAAERTASVANRASFLAVSTGVLVAASTAQLWNTAGVVGICALALASIGLLCAAVALRPGKRLGLQARRLVDQYLETTRTANSIEVDIVRDKANVLTAQEHDLRSRAHWVWGGFFSLAAGTILLTVVYAIEVIGS